MVTTARHPLVVTDDPELLDDLLRLAAAGGVDVRVAADAAGARSSWSAAPLRLVGADAVAECAGQGLPRRAATVVVCRSEPDATVWRQAVAVGAERVLALPEAEAAVVRRLAEAVESPPADPSGGRVLCCVGGCGGAGASVLAAGLAITAGAEGQRPVLLVDLDEFGGGLDLVLGGEAAGGLRWPDLAATAGRVSAAALHAALPTVAGVTVLSTDRGRPAEVAAEAVRAVLEATSRAGDLVVVDLPRAPTAAARAAVEVADRVLLVVPAEVRACAAAASTARTLAGWTDRIEVVVRAPGGAGLDAGAVAGSLDLPLAGTVRSDLALRVQLDRGEPPIRRGRGALAALCRDLLDDGSARGGRHHQRRAA